MEVVDNVWKQKMGDARTNLKKKSVQRTALLMTFGKERLILSFSFFSFLQYPVKWGENPENRDTMESSGDSSSGPAMYKGRWSQMLPGKLLQ